MKTIFKADMYLRLPKENPIWLTYRKFDSSSVYVCVCKFSTTILMINDLTL